MESSNCDDLAVFRGQMPQERRPNDGREEELKRVKMHLQQVTKKNQDLEEMLLFTTQELEKERENSRSIVLTLTERLMESREMINKLETENMRYKKDCMLAVDLLQCNKKTDQTRLSSTIEKLSDYTNNSQVKDNTNQNSARILKENKLQMVRTDEIPVKRTKSLQQSKSWKLLEKRNNSNYGDMNKTTNVDTALLQEETPVKALKENQQLENKETTSFWNNVQPQEKKPLAFEKGEDSLDNLTPRKESDVDESSKDMPFVYDCSTSTPDEEKQSSVEKKRHASVEVAEEANETVKNHDGSHQEDIQVESLMQILSEKNPLMPKHKILPRKKSLKESTSSLTDDKTQLEKEKKPLIHDNESSNAGDTTLVQHSQERGESVNTSTAEKDGMLVGDGERSEDNHDLSNEREKLLNREEKMKESLTKCHGYVTEITSFMEGYLNEENNQLLTDEDSKVQKCMENDSASTEVNDHILEAQENTPSTQENLSSENKSASTEKETEHDTFFGEENTPLV